ncbi:MAG: hypothetical protein IH627_08995 [Rubrivivax sp.]|nr:hypothetical protein [Rubrivivax sp.]
MSVANGSASASASDSASTSTAHDADRRATAWELHDLLLRELVKRLRDGARADVLGVARAMLKHEGITALDLPTDRRSVATKRLQRLYLSITDKLLEAVQADEASAAVLHEAIRWVTSQGVGKDLGAAIDTAAALRALKSTDLPFQ